MDTNTTNRLEAYKNLPDSIAHLYGSPESGEELQSIAKKHGLLNEYYKIFVNCVGDAILGFYKTTDLPRLFQQKLNLSADESQRLTSSLIEFLNPVVHRETVAAEAKRQDLEKLSTTFQKPSLDRLQNPHVESLAENVEPLRTMEGDMNRIHGYGAYRAQEQTENSETAEKVVESTQDNIISPKTDTQS